MDKTERFKKLLEVATEDRPSTKEVTSLISQIISVVKDAQAKMHSQMSQNMKECERMCAPFLEVESNLTDLVERTSKNLSDKWYKALNGEVYKLEQVIANLEQYDDTQIEAKFTAVIAYLSDRIDSIKPFIPTAPETRDLLETLEGDERLSITAIKGWEDTLKDIKGSGKDVRLVGGTNGIQLYVDGVKKGNTKYLNLVAGSGVTLTHTGLNGLNTITISATGGGGAVVPEVPTGTIDGSNTVFTFTATPKVIIVDQGRTLIENNGFTLAGLVATVDVAPEFSIFSI